MAGVGSAIGGIAGLGMGIFGGIEANQAAKWARDALATLTAKADAIATNTQGQYTAMLDPTRNLAADSATNIGRTVIDQAAPLMEQAGNIPAQIAQIYGRDPRYWPADLQNQYGYQAGLQTGLEPSTATAQGMFQGGNPQAFQDVIDASGNYLNGRGSNSQLALGDVGPSLLSDRGQTAWTQGTQDLANQVASKGGWNPYLTGAGDAAQGTLNAGGVTAGSQALTDSARGLMGAAMPMIQQGGNTAQGNTGMAAALGLIQNPGTATSNALQQRGMDLFNKNPDMTTEQATTFAREDAVRAAMANAGRASRDAYARGGGPGTVIGSGQRNQALADYADTTGQAEAAAVRDALFKQQQIQLGMMNSGLTAAQAGAGIDLSRLGTGASMLPSLLQAATGKLNAAGSIAGTSGGMSANALQDATARMNAAQGVGAGVTNAAGNYVSPYLQAGSAAGQLENSRMGTGVSAMQELLKSQADFGGLMTGAQTAGGQFQLGAGGLQNQFTNTNAGIGANINDTLLKAGQVGSGMQQANANSVIAAQNPSIETYKAITAPADAGLQAMTQLTGQSGDVYKSALGLLAAPIQGLSGITNPSGAWTQAGNAALGAAGAAAH